MATATVEFDSVDGQTLTLELYPFGSDTASFSVSATERTNDKGLYQASIVAPTEGWYNARAKNAAGTSIGRYVVYLQNAAKIFRAGDPSPSFTGSMAAEDVFEFFQLALRVDSAIATDRAVALALINANEGSGAGAFDNTVPPPVNTTKWGGAAVPALSTAGNVPADIQGINNNTGGVAALDRSARAIATGTVGTGSTTTNIVTSALSPAAVVAGQFAGRILIFDKNATTAHLRSQGSPIATNDVSGNITLSPALTDPPVSGDTFTIT